MVRGVASLHCCRDAGRRAAADADEHAGGPRAAELFERDWVLMNWALKFHDRDRDILLSPGEAQQPRREFRRSPTAT
jgi:hypothetical protein